MLSNPKTRRAVVETALLVGLAVLIAVVLRAFVAQAFRMREWCNPFETYQAFGEERWKKRTAEIMATHNVPWPESQAKH